MRLHRLISDRRGASAAEFGIVLPLFILFLLGIIDVGRWLWTYNHIEKATQMGARWAVVTTAASPGIDSSYLGTGGLTQGDVIPASAFGKIICTNTSCSCDTPPCPTLGSFRTNEFNKIADRTRLFYHEIQRSNVTVEYSSSGLGYAGNPNGPDVNPVVTVRVSGLFFTPLACEILGCRIAMPNFVASLTLEDGLGQDSN